MPAPDKIKQLVETFEQNLNEYQTRETEKILREVSGRSSPAADERTDKLVASRELSHSLRSGMIYGLMEEEVKIVES